MIRKALHDCMVANDLLRKRLDDREKLIAKISNVPYDYVKTHNVRDGLAKIFDMQDDLAKVENMQDDFGKDLAIHEAKARFIDEQVEMSRKKREDYLTALRRYHELKRSTMEKFAKVGAAVGLVGGLLLILAKVFFFWCITEPSWYLELTFNCLGYYSLSAIVIEHSGEGFC